MSASLHQLWRNRLSTLVANLAAGEREYEEIANLARHIGADYSGRFLVELLQNANDQACLAGMGESTVVILRTAQLVAVTNEGLPFKEDGIRAITSLGVSPKDPRFTIGNKGVGFKAVFEVTDGPEIYSAPADQEHGRFSDIDGAWFQLHQAPLTQAKMRKQLSSILEELLAERPDVADKIAESAGVPPIEAAMRAIADSAPFRYPIPLDKSRLQKRLADIPLPDEAADAKTLVVLPLLSDADGASSALVQKIVDDAIQDLIRLGAGTVLFLTGIGKIVIDDRVRGVHHVIRRDSRGASECLSSGAHYSEALTHHHQSGPVAQRLTQRWLIASRTIGEGSSKKKSAPVSKASAELNAAAQELPGKNWRDVKTATVIVAVAIPDDGNIGASLGTNGYLCIGLPTRVPTKTPLWVDARFHGNISRTEVNWTTRYNQLLLNASVSLVRDLVERLKEDPSIARRRLAALVLEPGLDAARGFWGPQLFGNEGVARRAIVLSPDSEHFLKAEELALPTSADHAHLHSFAGDDIDVAAFGFVLPESVLLDRGRPILEKLPGYRALAVRADPRFLSRTASGKSFIEQVAINRRKHGAAFWVSFFTWLLDRYSFEELRTQRIIPIRRDVLVSADDRVFYRPWSSVGGVSQDASTAREEDDEVLGELPESIRDTLPFLDETALPIRENGRKKLTALGLRLAPDNGPGMVHKPRRSQLINDVILPRLQEAAQQNGKDALLAGVALLRQALRWLSLMVSHAPDYETVKKTALLVPVLAANGKISWARPTGVYFGVGWIEGRHGTLLAQVCGTRPNISLIGWSKFGTLLQELDGDAPDRGWWCRQLAAIGVASTPRVRQQVVKSVFCSQRGKLGIYATAQGSPELESFWVKYRNAFNGFPVQYKNGDYDLSDLTWVDGLERAESRAASFELMMMYPADYEKHLTANVAREKGGEVVSAQSFWVWILRSQQWKVIPLSEAYCEPRSIWLLNQDHSSDTALCRFLDHVPRHFEKARNLLTAIGVSTLTNAQPGRLIFALHQLAERLSPNEQDERPARALAAELYLRLATAVKDEAIEQTSELRDLREHPIPVVLGRALVAVNPKSLSALYVVDDPVRRDFLDESGSHYFVPLRSETPEERLARVLKQALGAQTVFLTSETKVETGFTPHSQFVDQPMLEYLEKALPGVTVDLVLLIAHSGHRRLEPGKEEFRRQWDRLRQTLLRRGRFGERFSRRAFFESPPDGAPVMLIDASLDWREVIEETWQIFGVSHRDVLAVYARVAATDPNRLRRFFRERRIGEAERAAVEAIVENGLAQDGLVPLQPVFLALWRQRHPQDNLKNFEAGWKKHSDSPQTLVTWLEVPALSDVLQSTRGATTDAIIEKIIESMKLGWEGWRAALAELGRTWTFEKSKAEFWQTKKLLWATLAALAARSDAIELREAESYLSAFQKATPQPDDLDHAIRPIDVLHKLAGLVRKSIQSVGLATKHADVVSCLDQLLALREWRDELLGENGPSRREVSEFNNFEAAERGERASEVSMDYFGAGHSLAKEQDEAEAVVAIAANDRLRRLNQGCFANRYSFLLALAAQLRSRAPKTFSVMSKAGSFDEVQPRSMLERLCRPMIADQEAHTPAETTRQVLGIAMSHGKIEGALRDGGALGDELKMVAERQRGIDLGSFLRQERSPAPQPHVRVAGGHTGTRSTSGPPNPQDRELVGRLGEAYVYELFRKIVPGFDHTAWLSENAVAYGVRKKGNDGAGCDFRFFDESGTLARRPKVECFIEVKSSSGDCSGPFSITSNEWLRAEACHQDPAHKLYLVVRVAHVVTAPRIFDVLVDPLQLQEDRKIEVVANDLRVYVGTVMPPHRAVQQ